MMYASVRPEEIVEVDASLRDEWILEAIEQTKNRIEAVKEGLSMESVTVDELVNLGFNKPVAEGVSLAFEEYDRLMVEKYVQMLQDAVDYVSMGEQAEALSATPQVDSSKDADVDSTEEKTILSAGVDEQDEEAEEIVLETIKENEGDDGVSWDLITKTCEKKGLDEARVDETLNALMDKGLIYEPVLGTIKTT